ncbi:MAG: hypothetical protein U1E65_34610 [Myxococcota bacterium]
MRALSILPLIALGVGCPGGPPDASATASPCGAGTADSPGVAVYRSLTDQAIALEADATHLGRPLAIPYWIVRNETHLNSEPGVTAYACGIPGAGGGDAPAVACEIHMEPEIFATSDDQIAQSLAHEALHCFQMEVITVNQYAVAYKNSKWVIEGAPWYGAVDVAYDKFFVLGTFAPQTWTTYVEHPEQPLFSRSYDAIGFYAELQRKGVDVWRKMDDQLRAVVSGDVAAYETVGGTDEGFLNAWAASYFRISGRPGFSEDWDMSGRALPDDARFTVTPVPIGDGDSASFNAPPYTNTPVALDLAADVVQLGTIGHVRLHDGRDVDAAGSASSTYCLRAGGCFCPGEMAIATQATSPLLAALTGGEDGAALSVSALSLDRFCMHPPMPPVPPNPSEACAGGFCGRSNGDPHLFTFDARAYAFQAAGEFVLAREGRDLEIQARQRPWAGSREVSLSSAFAMNVAGDRVGFYLLASGTGVAVRIGGAPRDLSPGQRLLLSGGGFLSRDGFDYTVTWPDGSQAFVRASGYWGLNVIVKPAAARGPMSGLLGASRTRDGTAVATPPSFDDLYAVFGDSWRVRPAESLFDYADGESTATFTDRTFPDRPLTAADLSAAARASAQATCAAAGVTDPQLLDDCTLDVGATGAAELAAGARWMQDAFTPLPPGTIRADGGPVTVRVAAAGATASVTFEAAAATKIFLDITASTLPDQCGVATLTGPTGAYIVSGCIIDGRGLIDGTVLPDTGRYTITIDPDGSATGTAVLRLILVHDQSEPIAIDGPTVIAEVAEPGAVSRFSFSTALAQRVFLDIPASTLPDQCGGVTLSHDGFPVADGCIIGGAGLIDAVDVSAGGTYTVTVDPSDRVRGRATLRLLSVVDQVGPIALGGPAVTALIDRPGKRALLSFDASAGATVVFDFSAGTLPDSCSAVSVHDPAGVELARGCVLGGAGSFTTPMLVAAGTYTLWVDPDARTTGQLTIAARRGP